MELSYVIIEVLKRHSSEEKQGDTKPLNQKEILAFLQADYPHLAEEITEKKVRTSLEKIMLQESALPDEKKMLRYTDVERKKRFWASNSLSDPELKFLIDSVLYGNIINTKQAKNLATRLQGLSRKNLQRRTRYASGGFGEQKYLPDIDVLENLNQILEAQEEGRKIRFDLNVYDAVRGRIALRPIREYTVSPLETVLHNGRYYLIAAFDGDKLYHFRIDLMTGIRKTDEQGRSPYEFKELKSFRRDDFMLKHPVLYGGQTKRFRLRIAKEHLTQAVDTFSSALKLIPGSETDNTVDAKVEASDSAMKYWLLQYGGIVEVIDPDEEFASELRQSVEGLYEKYWKK